MTAPEYTLRLTRTESRAANGALSERTVVCGKLLALVLLFAFAPLAWVADIRASVAVLATLAHYGRPGALYAGAVLLSFAALAIMPFVRNHWVRCALVAAFLTTFAFDRIVLASSGQHVDVNLLRMFWHNRSMAGTVLGDYLPIIAPHLLVTIALGTVLAWPPPRGLPLWSVAVPAAALVVVPVQYASWKGVIAGYPSPFLIAARVSTIIVRPSTYNDLELQPVTIPRDPDATSRFDTIVVVMDESVRGDYLTINNGAIDTTPFLAASAGRTINFGIATSAANCSVASRWMFRRGVQPWQLPNQPSLRDEPDGIVTGPRTTIWQFAKEAGFRTVYVDPFRTDIGSPLHSGLDRRELRFVDEHVAIDAPRDQRDAAAARLLISALRGGGRTFLYIDKVGAHFPYDANYPANFNRYARPDGGRFVYSHRTRADSIGSYKNAVSWNVDGFFRYVLQEGDFRRALFIYTSDHGQTLWADSTRLWRHCGDNPPPDEVWVPLLTVTGDDAFAAQLRSSAARSFNQATHFDIFPTLLITMGYRASEVHARYGSTLLNIPSSRQRQFVTGDVIGGDARRWFDAVGPDARR
jgi:lipid A ethanolaminephosphotransferase